MKLAVVGSREFNNYDLLYKVLDEYEFDVVISGGARGADTLAEIYAKENDKDLIVFPAQWEMYGKKAGIIRNEKIVEKADKVIAFWDGQSKGTKNTIELAKKAGKLLLVVYFNQEETMIWFGKDKE